VVAVHRPGGDFLKGLAATIEGLVSLNLEPGANPPTPEELALWELEGRDIAGEFGPNPDTPSSGQMQSLRSSDA
jgi:hypothetical protein